MQLFRRTNKLIKLNELKTNIAIQFINNHLFYTSYVFVFYVHFYYYYFSSNNYYYSLHDQSDSRSLSDSLDNIPSSVFGPEGLVTRFTLPLSYGRKDARQKRQG